MIFLLALLVNILALLITTDVTVSNYNDTLEEETSFGDQWLPDKKQMSKKRVTLITEEYRFHLQLDVAKFLIYSTKPNFTFRMLPKFIWLEDISMCYFKTTLSKECNKIVLTGRTKCPSNPLFCLQQQICRIE